MHENQLQYTALTIQLHALMVDRASTGSRRWYWCCWRVQFVKYPKYYSKYYTWYLIVSAGRNIWDGASSTGYYWEIDEDSLVGHFIFMIITMILMIRSQSDDHSPVLCLDLHQSPEMSSSRTKQSAPNLKGGDWNCGAMKLGKFVSMHFAAKLFAE